MCISKAELDKKVVVIKEYKSIKKDAEANLKPLEQEVKEYMEETNQSIKLYRLWVFDFL